MHEVNGENDMKLQDMKMQDLKMLDTKIDSMKR